MLMFWRRGVRVNMWAGEVGLLGEGGEEAEVLRFV